jgi:hypothetical protein
MGMTTDDSRDDHLFDGSGPPDPDVQRLERLLRPLGTSDDRTVPAMPAPGGDARTTAWTLGGALVRRRATLVAGGIAALLLAALIVGVVLPTRTVVCRIAARPVQQADVEIRDSAVAGRAFDDGSWVETSDAERELLVGDVGRIRLAPRSRLQVRHATEDTTLLYLARGSMEATVSADARPRFFQVDTDAARCVDLGCRYTLDVAEDGVATVRVTLGQVAFETKDREVFVPAGATCVARPGSGPGTPRFETTRPDVAEAFDAFDQARDAPPARRRALARAALDAVREPRETLLVWHLLQDADADIVRAAETRLLAVAGTCGVACTGDAADVRRAWKEDLHARCW